MSSEEVSSNQKPYKRKRKKTFLRNARKYAKKGHYGRGTELEADTYQYFVRIMEVYREGFETDDDKKIFVNNVFEQTENNEVNCSCNQVGCRIIETLLPFANDTVLERFMTAFASDLRPLCSDRFASHVIEALITQSCTRSLESTYDDTHKIKYKEFTLKVSKFLLNNLEDYVWDTYGSHIIRTVLLNLSIGDDEYAAVIIDYAERLITWPQFNDLPYDELTSGLLQVMLQALVKINLKLFRKYLKKLIDESFSVDIFSSKPATMLLEMVLQTATPKLFTKLNTTCFTGKLVTLANTSSSNFAVQKLLTHCSDKAEFEAMFDELSDSFHKIIDAGHTGVILALAQACKRLMTKQGNFVQNLMKALHCFEPEDRQNSFIISLCKFVTYENVTSVNLDKDKLSLHGTLILQVLLEFNKPIKIVTGILSMEADDIKKLFSNMKGSHIVDSYAKSQYVGEKSREKLIRKLQGTYQELASSKYGSRSFEALWNVASLKFRLNIMDELSHKESLWSNSEFGKIIAVKVNMGMYKRNKEEWKNSLNNSTKVRELTNLLK